MTCIKTGAMIFFSDYGTTVPADLYTVGDCTIIRSNPNSVKRASVFSEESATHICYLPPEDSFSRDDIGVFVVPSHCVTSR